MGLLFVVGEIITRWLLGGVRTASGKAGERASGRVEGVGGEWSHSSKTDIQTDRHTDRQNLRKKLKMIGLS